MYTLLSLSGLAPQVITEAAWSLAKQHHPPLVPERVEAIATGVGEAFGRALLFGEEVADPITGSLIPNRGGRWDPFCDATFGHPVPLRFHVPKVGGQPLYDITGVEADRHFADLCYRLVAELTQPEAPPLVGSLAGGRKTLSAHLMSAFAVYARPQDRLIHVLVHPASAERNPYFFYPTPSSEARVHRIDVPFPRLRTVLEASPLRQNLLEKGDLRSLLETLEPHLLAEVTPDAAQVHLRYGGGELTVCGGGQLLGRVRLTSAEAATLMTTAEAIALGGGQAQLDALAGNVGVEELRRDALSACGRFDPLKPWSDPSDVSKAVSRLNRTLSAAPVLARYFSVESDVQADATYYRWAEPLPCPLGVLLESRPNEWRFRALQEEVE